MITERLESRICLTTSLQPDLSFGNDGTGNGDLSYPSYQLEDSHGRLVQLQTEGDIEFGPFDVAVNRLTTHGKIDRTFNGGKDVDVDGTVSAAVLQTDDKILFIADSTLYRLTTDGKLDTTFGDGGRVQIAYGQFDNIRVLSTGKIRVSAGTTDAYQFNADGSFDTSFASAGHVAIHSTEFAGLKIIPAQNRVFLDSEGHGYLFLQAQNGLETYLARLTDGGTLDNGFGQAGLVDLVQAVRDSSRPVVEIEVPTLRFFSDDRILVDIRPTVLSDTSHRLICLLADGAHDSAFGNGGVSDFIAKASVNNFSALVDLLTDEVYVSVSSQQSGSASLTESIRLGVNGFPDKKFGRQGVFIGAVTAGGRLFDGLTRYAFRGPATLDGSGRLFIDGTGGNDTTTIAGDHVTVNGNKFLFQMQNVRQIQIQGGAGTDRIISDADVPTTVTLSTGYSFVQTGSADDNITGGFEGHDTIDAGAGNDYVAAGVDSFITAGSGKDTIYGGSDDTIFGGTGNDHIYVSTASRRPAHISGDGGNDIIEVTDGSAYVDGKGGNDILYVDFLAQGFFLGGSGADTLLSVNRSGDQFFDLGPTDGFKKKVTTPSPI